MSKIYPSLTHCLKFSIKTIGLVLGVVFSFGTAVRFVKGEPVIGFYGVAMLLLFGVGMSAVGGLMMYLTFRFLAWSVEPTGISGRTYWGRRSYIAWGDVAGVSVMTIEGMPAVLVTSTKSNREVYAYTLGVNIPEIHARLVRQAGPDHVLTRKFRPIAA